MIRDKHGRIKNPNWQEATGWDDQEQIQQVARAGLKHRTAAWQVQHADFSAMLPPIQAVLEWFIWNH